MVATTTPSPTTTTLTSAGTFGGHFGTLTWDVVAGILALLDEGEAALKTYALTQLNAVADQFWAEIADALSKMQVSVFAKNILFISFIYSKINIAFKLFFILL